MDFPIDIAGRNIYWVNRIKTFIGLNLDILDGEVLRYFCADREANTLEIPVLSLY